MRAWRGNDESDPVLAASSGPSSHLLQFRSSERLPAAGATSIGASDYDSARGEVDTGRNRRGRENRVEQARAHHLFNHQLPRGHVTGMMRPDAAANDGVPMSMGTNLGMLFDEGTHEVAARLATLVTRSATTQRGFRGSFITAASRRQENYRRQQIVRAQCREQRRRRHFRHAKFHLY